MMTRVEPPGFGDERATLLGYLDYHRETLALICAGLSPAELMRTAVAPSELSLLGLVRHLAEVEQQWWQNRVAGLDLPAVYLTPTDEDGDLHLPAIDPVTDPIAAQALVDEAFATWRFEVERSRPIAAAASLDATFHHERGEDLSMRWLILHLIEEYARHNGHADLLRESIDGVTGR
jgi:hypothetical protein